MRDQNLTVRKAGATTAGTTYTGTLDTKAPKGVGEVTGRAKLFLDVPAITGLSDTKNVVYTLQDSEDGTNFTDVPGFGARTFTGASGAGAPATFSEWEWSKKLRRYLRVKEVVDGTPGSIAAYNYDFGVVYGGTPGI